MHRRSLLIAPVALAAPLALGVRSASAFTSDELIYFGNVAGSVTLIGGALNAYDARMADPLMADSQWIESTVFELRLIGRVTDHLSTLAPPATFADLHGELTAALETINDAAEAVIFGLRGSDATLVVASNRDLGEAVPAFTEAVNGLAQAIQQGS